MAVMPHIDDALDISGQPFRVIEEFAALNLKRKVLLCDLYFAGEQDMFESTVTLLWPEAAATDIRKLEKFLTLLKETAH